MKMPPAQTQPRGSSICEGASYRVKLIPDMAAKVEKIDEKDKTQDQKDQSGQDD